jgi:SAM-dependent methyltransferase
MDRVAAMPVVQEYKAHMRSLFDDVDGLVLDVGCGVGNDVRALGARGLGVDPSRTMLDVAASRGGRFVCAVVEELPFARSTMGGVSADRVLQHVVDPDLATRALVRVARRGGMVVAADPDQATLQIEGPEPELADVVRHYRAERGIRNGFLAGRMAEVLRACDLVDVDRASWTQEMVDPEAAFGITTWSRFLVDTGWFDEQQAARFDESLAAAGEAGTFAYRVDITVTWGRVP